MLIQVCNSKIHRATVTQAELHYVGSITIDQTLLTASGIKPFQMVNITNVSNGTLWQTYAIPGGKGQMCLNGPPARHFHPGDKIIILALAYVDEKELAELNPVVVFVDDQNEITEIKKHKTIPLGSAED